MEAYKLLAGSLKRITLQRGLVVLVLFAAGTIAVGTSGRVHIDTSAQGEQPVTWHVNRLAFVGYDGMASSVAWVNALLNYADIVFNQSPCDDILSEFALAASADTLWSYPSLAAAWILPGVCSLTERDVVPFLERGAKAFPNEWKFRLTWAQYVLFDKAIDSAEAYDSAAAILVRLTESKDSSLPVYARDLAYTLMLKNGKGDKAIGVLSKNYKLSSDPLVRYHLVGKIVDLLRRNQSWLAVGRDTTDFVSGISTMLESNDGNQFESAVSVLQRLSVSRSCLTSVADAKEIARQYRRFKAQRELTR